MIAHCSLHPDFRDGRVQALPQFGLTSRSFACHRVRIVCRRTVNPPFRVFAQLRVKPRKLKLCGLGWLDRAVGGPRHRQRPSRPRPYD